MPLSKKEAVLMFAGRGGSDVGSQPMGMHFLDVGCDESGLEWALGFVHCVESPINPSNITWNLKPTRGSTGGKGISNT